MVIKHGYHPAVPRGVGREPALKPILIRRPDLLELSGSPATPRVLAFIVSAPQTSHCIAQVHKVHTILFLRRI